MTAKRGARPELLALLQAAKDSPDDDTPRFVLAEWLEEHGDESERARAELIRVQCALRNQRTRLPKLGELRRRETALFREHFATWLGPIHELIRTRSWSEYRSCRRGLLHFSLEPRQFLKQASLSAQSEAWAWLDGISLFSVSPEDLQCLAALPVLAHLRKLSIDQWHKGDTANALKALASSPHLTQVCDLQLKCDIGHEEVGTLASLASLPRLTALSLDCRSLDAAGVSVLAGSPHLSRLTRLKIHGMLFDAGATGLADSPFLANLEELHLCENTIGPTGAEALIASSRLSCLRSLNLHGNALATDGVRVLAGVSGLSRLTALDVGGNQIGWDGLSALLESPHVAHGLTLGASELFPRIPCDRASVEAFAATPGLAKVSSLDLSGRVLGPEGIRILLASPYLVNLEELRMEYSDLAAADVAALLSRSLPPRLTRLKLRANNLGDEGGWLLANSPHMAQITSLDVSGTALFGAPFHPNVTSGGAKALAKSPYLGNLTELLIDRCGLDAEAVQALDNSPRLQNLSRLETWFG